VSDEYTKVLKLSSEVDECKPLDIGPFVVKRRDYMHMGGFDESFSYPVGAYSLPPLGST